MTLRLRSHAIWIPLVAIACSNAPSSQPIAPVTTAPEAPEEKPPLDLAQIEADPREPLLAQGVGHMLESEHLKNRAIDDEVSREAFAEYLARLDYGKLFMLKEHVDQLRRYADQMDDQMREGDLELARVGAALMSERQEVVAEIVAERLSEPFDFALKEELETDAEEREFAETDEELADRWRRVLKLQVLERIVRMEEMAEALKSPDEDADDEDDEPAPDVPDSLADIPDTFEGREKKAREDLAKSYDARFTRMTDLQALEPTERFLNAIATVYDPHTRYLAPADKENFDIQMSGSLEGIGAVLSEKDHYIVVREVVPGGASWRQGELEAGDLILAVAQEDEEPVDVADMRIDRVVKMIRGPKGTVVTLTIKKPDDRIEIISITRDVVEIEAAYARGAILDLGPEHDAMGYIHLPSFYGNTRSGRGNTPERNATDDVRTLLERFDRRDLGGVVIDLRGNGGGLLDHARDITGMFIETGPVVQTRYSDGKSQVLKDSDPSVSYQGDVVVLVDRFSASASEILAGALQDYRRAVIVGTGPTHGKGTVQVLVDLNRLRRQQGEPLGVLKLTIQQFFRIDGDSTQWRGVVPDVTLPDPGAHIESGERYLDNSIPWSEVEPLDYTPWPEASWDVDTLVARSAKRRADHKAFSKITTRGELLDRRSDQTVVPLSREEWIAKREADRKALEEADPKLEEGPERFEVSIVDYHADDPPTRESKKDGERPDPLEGWREQLAHDPWVEEALHVLADMD